MKTESQILWKNSIPFSVVHRNSALAESYKVKILKINACANNSPAKFKMFNNPRIHQRFLGRFVADQTGRSPALAMYFGPPLDGARPARLLVNAADPRGLPRYEVMTLMLHEVEPGHHLQVDRPAVVPHHSLQTVPSRSSPTGRSPCCGSPPLTTNSPQQAITYR